MASDIQWEHKLYKDKNMFEHFPDVQFYDYTKIPTRKVSQSNGENPCRLQVSFLSDCYGFSTCFTKLLVLC